MALINGTASADTLQGTADADSITPLAGADIVNALGGDDTINVTQAAEVVKVAGGEGNDTLKITGVDAAQPNLSFFADSNITDAGVVSAAASSGTADTIIFSNLADLAANGSVIAYNADGTVDITQQADGSANNLVIETTGVERVVYSNGSIDLNNPNTQYLTNDADKDGQAEGAAASTALADADINTYTNGTFAVGAGDVANTKPVITSIGGVAVTKDGTYSLTGALSNYEVVVAGTQTTMVLNAEANVDAEDVGVALNEDVVVVYTFANGDTMEKVYNFTDAFDNTDADTVSGTAGDDIIDLGAAADVMKASAGNDTILGGAGDDSILGGAGNDRLDAGIEGATLNGGAGDDVLIGGAGTDVAEYSGGIGNGAVLKTTTATIEGTDTISTTVDGVRAKNLGQSIHGIEMQGRNGTDGAGLAATNVDDQTFATIATLADNDVIGGVTSSSVGGGGSSSIKLSDDLLKYTASTGKFATITATTEIDDWQISGYAFEGTAIVAATKGATVDTGAGKITFNSLDLEDAVVLTHTASSNASSADVKKDLVIELTNGTEKRHIVVELTLTGDNEVKTGTDGADLLSGGRGDDNYKGGKGNDSLDGGDGADTLDGGEGDDLLTGGDDNDKITGGDGNDSGNGGDGNDTIDGGKGNDVFFAGADDRGDDSMSGGDGDDELGGGAGRDTIDGGAGANKVYGGDDNDTLTLTSGDDSVHGASEGWGGEGNDSITGGSLADVIGGADGNDTINSGSGNDTIYGGKTGDETIDAGKGDDLVFASTDRDTVTAGEGNDTVWGGDGKDSITGDAGDDLIYGGSDNDTIDGGAGKDTITGAAGNDSLTGGANADTFKFGTGSGSDTVSDFKTADGDVLDLTGYGLTNQDILSYAQEQTVSGSTGIILNFGNNDSVFLADVTLSQVRDANIVWEETAG